MKHKIIIGDCLDSLAELPPDTFQTCITSPPYYGLRDYGTASWAGGDPVCDHVQRTNKHGGTSNRPGLESQTYQFKDTCGKCGADRTDLQIGLEDSLEEHISTLVDVFRAVRRVLRPDGTLWLNYGDAYAGTGKSGGGKQGEDWKKIGVDTVGPRGGKWSPPSEGYKRKDLLGLPWRLAFALQADGWWLRSDIIWHKPNPMPSSVTDRPTSSHEYMFLLSPSQKYFYDADAVREKTGSEMTPAEYQARKKNMLTVDWYPRLGSNQNGKTDGGKSHPNGRNLRDVWTIPIFGLSAAHFATFPPKLVEPCIKAGSRPGDKVLDPFGGAGTVGLVADRLGRDSTLLELNPEYAELARKRLIDDAPLLCEVKIL